jgi:alkyl hydroperoxide reductase subunit AhpC
MTLRIGSQAPDFEAETTQGPIQFHEFKKNKWCILFSHPEDYTPVCTTELAAVARLVPEFHKMGTCVLALSCDGLEDHHGWIRDIEELGGCQVTYPIIADPHRKVATLYDMLDHQDPTNVDTKGMPLTVRSVFFMDPGNVIRAMVMYPASTGRNFEEIKRVLASLQLVDQRKVATPEGWVPGGEVIVHNAVKEEEAQVLFPGFKTIKPYLRTVRLE